ncbi:MAG: redoxin domain-containing protein [Pseudomonadota bacterium]
MSQLRPGTPFPNVSLPTLDGAPATLHDPNAFMTVIDVYRGLHCPKCKAHLEDLSALRDDFKTQNVTLVMASTDPEERAREAASTWAVEGLRIAHGMSIEQARGLGLLISSSIREGETDRFAEPGVFIVQGDGTLYGSIINSFPFARPAAKDLLDVVNVVKERQYPPRGTLAA